MKKGLDSISGPFFDKNHTKRNRPQWYHFVLE